MSNALWMNGALSLGTMLKLLVCLVAVVVLVVRCRRASRCLLWGVLGFGLVWVADCVVPAAGMCWFMTDAAPVSHERLLWKTAAIGNVRAVLEVVSYAFFLAAILAGGQPPVSISSSSDAPESTARRLVTILATVFLAAAFFGVFIGAGCGVAPVGLLMFMGNFSAWGVPVTLGWCGIALSAAALFFPVKARHAGLAAGGAGCLAVSWGFFLSCSETAALTLVCSVPFLFAVVFRLITLWLWRTADCRAATGKSRVMPDGRPDSTG